LTVDDIQLRLIRLATQRGSAAAAATAGEDASPLLHPPRRPARPHAGQILYLKHIQEHDITFSTAPRVRAKPTLPLPARLMRWSATSSSVWCWCGLQSKRRAPGFSAR
jgi:hypothetical protein